MKIALSILTVDYKNDDQFGRFKNNIRHGHGEQTCGCQGGRGGSGMDWEFGLVDANYSIWSG